jgi:CHAT domain-containing protein
MRGAPDHRRPIGNGLAVRAAQRWRGNRSILVSGPGTDRGDQEVHAIAGLHPGSTVLTGTAATPDAALGALDGATVAHFAAHGHHQAENALFSSLELAGGPMFGHDLQHLPRPPALVVLSCCELGLTDVRPGDESVGMASALLAAGAATVVASVSRVADEAAMTVMVDFHRSIVAGRSPARALAEVAPGRRATGFVCFGAG